MAIHIRKGISFGRNDEAPLPVLLRNDGTVETLPLTVWDPLSEVVQVRLDIILSSFLPDDEIAVAWNQVPLDQKVRDSRWKDPQIFSPSPQPLVMTPGALQKNVDQQELTRLQFAVPRRLVLQGENMLQVFVSQRRVYETKQMINVEKVELHVSQTGE